MIIYIVISYFALHFKNKGSADKMRSSRFAQMRCIYRGFVDDERTAQMCEDGWLNLSVIPKVLLTLFCDTKQHPSKKRAAAQIVRQPFSLQQTSPYLPASFL